ncbi:2-amino-4-hydroxy-6-hydroxymethyldihydropteridine diphosphokinase [candidate division WOR-1 bacterium RIFOXYB2_FULL_42_35]|uniref:2-amino-4-hydroxy-6-hydroxymethyldihydropteridine diphosphokinase n=1 Tax=candidate division WOR-1 bacterium RIFOXYC2_FULL_41_25 TaxID=1802586 RepID=A0A1F4TPP1_UNCSA|nr:MAG: 2-amino-4-hydroxy-6-hydroxymethyldihydropteridine diphosphokinase [candidate division WOR-1 bacterium RIFOXYB2_FULL_42_35]OGC24580.1 MAG: 2-amino-4-hydroxy-6-hydroxymethyldihydropteridine diphosphokinase [candidate division WOR-1 bacterium RIFOXYA2_FULL_41_14]OGC34626.1 MAG: 2-amino-4-hydroxy-6-hydroxymethyldihydropteridine diphosphokinase [candidate division WOR-1 bacterium RIFOXYC2_FULL_41_25]OGC42093.1 MAG: 2-amino-4-hydroxy-6-hydroxymethyldihydropteridine diphosphokinase [candidate d
MVKKKIKQAKTKIKGKSKGQVKKITRKAVEKVVAKNKKKSKNSVAIAYLGLGSNVGDREEYIEQAIFLLEKNPKIEGVKHSSNYETEAEGGQGSQPPFINAVLEIKTKLTPQQLLESCQEIEAALGREREVEWGPRTIDIDILLYDGEIISEKNLQIPHPLMHERLFVLRPLREVAPNLLHPILEKSIDSLYDERKADQGATYDDDLPGFKEIKGARDDDFERW